MYDLKAVPADRMRARRSSVSMACAVLAICCSCATIEPGRLRRLAVKTLPAKLERGMTYVLSEGLHPAPASVPEGVTLEGEGLVVLVVPPGGAGIALEGGRLERLTVQGGAWGVVAKGKSALSHVGFSGQTQGGVRVAGKGATLVVRQAKFEAVGASATAIDVADGAQLHVDHASFRGSFRRAIEVRSATASLTHLASLGARELIHAIDSTVSVDTVSASSGSGPALFAAGSSLRGQNVTVEGHSYGVMVAKGSTLDLKRVNVRRTLDAGLACLNSKATLHGIDVTSPGVIAGLQMLECDVDMSDVVVRKAQSSAVVLRLGKARVAGLKVFGVAADDAATRFESGGDGLHIRGGSAEVIDLEVEGAAGSGAFVSASATVELGALVCRRCAHGGLFAEKLSRVVAQRIEVEGSIALVSAFDKAKVTLVQVPPPSLGGPVWIDCTTGASLEASWSGAPPWNGFDSPCVQQTTGKTSVR